MYLYSCVSEVHEFTEMPDGINCTAVVDAVGSSGIMFGKQKLGVTFNSDKLGGIDFTKFSKLTMCSAGAGRCWLVLEKVYV